MEKKFLFYLLTIIATACIISCGDHKKSKAETTDSKMSFLRSKDVEKAMDELKSLDKLRGKKIMVFQNIYFYQNREIILSIADPGKPENVDRYTYKEGKWMQPEPVELVGSGEVSDNVVNLEEINYKAVPDIMKVADEKAKEIGAKTDDITHYLQFSFSPMSDTKIFHININKDDEIYVLTFDIDGKFKELRKIELTKRQPIFKPKKR